MSTHHSRNLAIAQAQVLAASYRRLQRMAEALEGEAEYFDSMSAEDAGLADRDPMAEMFARLLDAHEAAGAELAELGKLMANLEADPDA